MSASPPDSLRGTTVLVTGGCGYIGSHVVLALLDAGASPVVVDDLSNGDARLLPKGVAFFQGDCGDPALLQKIGLAHSLTAIMHFAGKIIVPESVAEPLSYYDGNTVKSLRLIEFAAQRGLKFIFSSTAAVYGAPAADGPIAETTPLSPINPYGRSKLMTEYMLADASAAHGLNYGALRYFNVAGADAQARAGQVGKQVSHLIRAAAQVALGLQPKLTVFGADYPTPDGTCIRDYIHVSDLAAVHVKALMRLLDGAPSFVVNCGYGRGKSVLEVVDAFQNVLGRTLPHDMGPRRAGDPPALVAKTEQARTLLNWRPQHEDLNDIVRTALAWEERRAAWR